MLPAHLAENIRKQVLFHPQLTFDFREKAVDKAFERLIPDPDTGLFKGPWVQLRRPFGPADASETVPFDFPIRGSVLSNTRTAPASLSSKSQQPKPTIVTTGTRLTY